MADRGYWKEQFRNGCSEAVAISWMKRVSVRQDVEDWLEKSGPEGVAYKTRGCFDARSLGLAAARGLDLVGKIVDELEKRQGPMDGEILIGLAVVADPSSNAWNAHYDPQTRWVGGLGEKLAAELGPFVQSTVWWTHNKKALTAACRRVKAVKAVHET